MAKKFSDLVDIIHNDENCIVLEVKKGVERDLIFLGCFFGDETMFRVTKGDKKILTIWRKNGESCHTVQFDKFFGFTYEPDEVIIKAIVNDFGVVLEGDGVKTTLGLRSTIRAKLPRSKK